MLCGGEGRDAPAFGSGDAPTARTKRVFSNIHGSVYPTPTVYGRDELAHAQLENMGSRIHGQSEILQALQSLTLQDVTAKESVWVRPSLSKVTTYRPLWPVYLFINECLLGNTG